MDGLPQNLVVEVDVKMVEEDGGDGRSESYSGRGGDGEGDGPAGGALGSRDGRDGKAAW